jgi:D-serine dehydratase
MIEVSKMVSNALGAYLIDDTTKGIPGGTAPFPLSEIAKQKWNVLSQDMPLPLMVLKRSALLHNVRAMNDFLREHRLSIAPHAKTHMSPQLAELQLSSGAWAITAGTANQVQVFRKFGVQRIVLANQLVGRQNVRVVVEAINADRAFDFYCLVDSIESVKHLAVLGREYELARPIKVLLEGGLPGGRAGVRTIEQARGVISELRKVKQFLALAGIEGFEGVISHDDPTEAAQLVSRYLGFLKQLLTELNPEDFSNAQEVIFSAGGSAYFDLVAKAFHDVEFPLPKRVLLRSGCYLTHDSGMYRQLSEQLLARESRGPRLQAAFEIWSYVQSVPEPGLAILTMGKRDCPYDYSLPRPLRRHRASDNDLDLAGCRIAKVNDQHAYMSFTEGMDLRFGDMIASGISHPCTAFDKWRFIPVVNDDYDVVEGIVTYF